MAYDANLETAAMVLSDGQTLDSGPCKQQDCNGSLTTDYWDQNDGGCVNSYYRTTCSHCDYADTNDIY